MSKNFHLSYERLATVQNEFLDQAFKSLVWITIPICTFELILWIVQGLNPELIAGLMGSMFILGVGLFQGKINHTFKSIALIAPIWVISLILLLEFRLQGLGGLLLLVSHLLAAVFFSRILLWNFIPISLTLLVCIAYFTPKSNTDFSESWAWSALVLTIACMTFFIIQLESHLRILFKRFFEQVDHRFERSKAHALQEITTQQQLHQIEIQEAQVLTLALKQLSFDSKQSVHSILGLCHFLSQKIENQELRDILSYMGSQCRQIRSMISQSSELAKSHKSFHQSNIEFDLIKQAKELLKSFESKALTNGIELKLVMDPNVPSVVKGNGMMINNILRSFFQISITHTLRGQIILQVIWEGEKKGKDLIRWVIRDNGFGLTTNQWNSIWQEDQTVLSDQPIAAKVIQKTKEWVAAQGGEMDGKSNPGQGNEFSLSLPLNRPIVRDQLWAEWVLSLRGTEVLIVDDRPYSSQILSQYLDELGLVVHVVKSNAEAIQAGYSNSNFKLIFISVEIGGLTGFELAGQMRHIFAKKAGIILIANHVEVEQESLGLSDVDALIELPFGRTGLVAQVVDVLRHYIPVPNRSLKPLVRLQNGRVLVVGSHEIERWVCQEILKKMGYHVFQARTNEEAKEIIVAPEGWTFILHNNDPSKADTVQFYEYMQSQPLYQKIPILGVLSAEDVRRDQLTFPSLFRPILADELAQKVQSLLRIHSAKV